MISIKNIAVPLIGAAVIAGSTFGIVSAAPTSNGSSSSKPGHALISLIRQDRLSAAAAVLNTSTANVKAAIKSHNLNQLITNAGLTKKTFAEKVHSTVVSDLKAKGYSSDQITIAMQRLTIKQLRHRLAHH